ncbi:hypothetical protein LPB67_02140 [Undibacterium sp. Jales W-56]|uniref:hypothetical protein n=1 Tax=Undibacterium sp. Jales W-56 TaxID=2897325 RepID=UPI0021D3309E|nr:hypothetical protein [Undibacterium sp. Jales W-56]MCU6432576.1 hypothetical protein [Undibacterium sp. Jales W-56]
MAIVEKKDYIRQFAISIMRTFSASNQDSARQRKTAMKSKIKRPTLHLPHERDEVTDAQPIAPKQKMKQAYSDLQRGMVDTDMHGERGVETVVTIKTKVFKTFSGRK